MNSRYLLSTKSLRVPVWWLRSVLAGLNMYREYKADPKRAADICIAMLRFTLTQVARQVIA